MKRQRNELKNVQRTGVERLSGKSFIMHMLKEETNGPQLSAMC